MGWIDQAEALQAWAVWMQGEGLAERTYKDRPATIRRLADAGLDIYDATSDEIVRILAAGPWSAGTRRTYYSTLEAWFRWLQRQGVRVDNPVDLIRTPRVPRRRPRPVSTDQLAAVLAVCNRHRTLAMVLLYAYEGLRAHEIAAMRGEYVRGAHLRVIGKGGVDVEIPLHPAIAEIAQRFPRIGLWFPSYRDPGHPITAKNVSAVISQAMRRAGVQGSGHQLRHWFGTETLRTSGGNLRVAQEALRHASVATTAIYTLVDDDEVRAAVTTLPVPMYAVKGARRRSAGNCGARTSRRSGCASQVSHTPSSPEGVPTPL